MCSQNPEDQLLSAQEVCAALDIKQRALARRIKAGKFPPPTRVVGGRRYWYRSVLSAAAPISAQIEIPADWVLPANRTHIRPLKDEDNDADRRAS